MLFWIFASAGALTWAGLRLAERTRASGGPRPEGVAFVAAVLLSAGVGFVFHELSAPPVSEGAFVTPDSITARPTVSPQIWIGAQLFLLSLAVYVLSALRGMGNFPAWVADVLVLGAAFVATRASSEVILQINRGGLGEAANYNLGPFDTLLTVLWIWLVARLCASLNRVPAVAGGYLGLFGLTVLLLLSAGSNAFASSTTAALAGAGLVAFALALKRPQINLGWSSILAMGWLLGAATSLGLLKNTLPAMVALAVLSLGLPLLNVSIVKVRASLRGHNVDWTNQKMRLDQALASRGVPARKIALYYFAVGAWLCLLAWLATRGFNTPSGTWLQVLYALTLVVFAAGGAIVFFSLARMQMRRREGEEIPESVEAFGVKISPVTMTEALDKVEAFIASGQPHHVLTSDANAILTSRNDPEYAAIMRNAALITPDGFGVIWGARLLNLPIYERVTGVDMVTGICERAAKRGHRIFIFGSEPGIAATAAANLTTRYPGLNVVGTHHGMVMRDPDALAKVIAQIHEAKPDVLFVAMGIPLQEKFIAKHLQELGVPVALGVGGSFDVYAGKFPRAPQYVQRAGMEWLYRVWIDPSRWKRMGYVPKFMLVALRTWLSGAHGGKSEAF